MEQLKGQTDLFDLIYQNAQQPINPIREVAKAAGVYWTTSKDMLINLCDTDPDIELWTKAVKGEYSPYGFSGGYGRSRGPNTVESWEMGGKNIEVLYLDLDGKWMLKKYSWAAFAREIADLIWSGEYGR